jgi:hypothetical protein
MILYYCLMTKVDWFLAIVRYFPGRDVTAGIRAIVCTRVKLTMLITWFWIKVAKIFWICKICWCIKDKLDRGALEGSVWVLSGGLLTWWSDIFNRSHLRVWSWVMLSPRVLHVCIPHVAYARQGYTPFKRMVSEVGRCPCSGLTHECRFYSER